jgi:hypothetical protein
MSKAARNEGAELEVQDLSTVVAEAMGIDTER